jgi:hypothetical protein
MSGSDRLDAAWDDLDDKDILIQILAELQTIRVALTDEVEAGASDDSATDGPATVTCNKCGKTIPDDDRTQHARNRHKCPPELTATLYE